MGLGAWEWVDNSRDMYGNLWRRPTRVAGSVGLATFMYGPGNHECVPMMCVCV